MLLRLAEQAEPAESSERGASAVEYGLLVAMIAGVIIAIVIVLGTEVIPLYDLTF